TFLAFALTVYEATFQTSRSLPPLLRGMSAHQLRRWPMAHQKSPPILRQAALLWRIRYRARAGTPLLPSHATPDALHPRWLQAALDRRGQCPAQAEPSQLPTRQSRGEMGPG